MCCEISQSEPLGARVRTARTARTARTYSRVVHVIALCHARGCATGTGSGIPCPFALTTATPLCGPTFMPAAMQSQTPTTMPSLQPIFLTSLGILSLSLAYWLFQKTPSSTRTRPVAQNGAAFLERTAIQPEIPTVLEYTPPGPSSGRTSAPTITRVFNHLQLER